MSEAAPAPAAETVPKGKSKGPLIGLALGLLMGGAAFGAIYTGRFDPMALLGGGRSHAPAEPGEHAAAESHGGGHGKEAEGAGNFLALDPITVSLAPDQSARHLRFTAQIETAPEALAAVTAVKPRILDVLNGYLRAVDVAELESPAAMPRLRAQMLRRVQLVGGGEAVRDILITEFILN